MGENHTTMPTISVAIPTRNRGDAVVEAVRSVLANSHPNFELLLIDQSSNDETRNAVTPFLDDPRLHYIPMNAVGTGRARNLGLQKARGEIVAMTDDDCAVPDDWLDTIQRAFVDHPDVAMLFCKVVPVPYDPQKGLVPTYEPVEGRKRLTFRDCVGGVGIGAGMAVRREAVIRAGGFDVNMGPGSPFRSAEELDLVLRVLMHGWAVYDLPDVVVVHDGFRDWEQYRELTRRNWFASGAAYAKPLKVGYWPVLILILYNIVVPGFLEPLGKVFEGRRPQGFKRGLFLIQGILAGLRAPVDRRNVLYRL